jgi:hypothetical protein
MYRALMILFHLYAAATQSQSDPILDRLAYYTRDHFTEAQKMRAQAARWDTIWAGHY